MDLHKNVFGRLGVCVAVFLLIVDILRGLEVRSIAFAANEDRREFLTQKT